MCEYNSTFGSFNVRTGGKMKITDRNRPFVFIVFFILFSFVLPFFAVAICMVAQGYYKGPEVFLCYFCMWLANLPSFLLKIYPYIVVNGEVVWDVGRGLIHPLVILVNAIGWALFGFIVGLIISAIKGRKRHQAG